MSADSRPKELFSAPTAAGALFLALLVLLAGCKQEEPVPEWKETPAPTSPAEPAPVSEPLPEPVPTPLPTPTPSPESAPVEEAPEEPVEEVTEEQPTDNRLRFVSYNLKNYLTMSRYSDGKRIDRFKPDDEIEALVKLVVDAKPDVLGMCEIGTYDDLLHFQKKLKEAGLDLPNAEHAGGADDTRHLGILSRLPITSRNTPKDLSYSIQGKDFIMSRGILDSTIEAGGHKFRFIGVHLKSKREIPEADQELMRRNEAYVLRKHVDSIFKEEPEALIVAYGDFNDTRRNTAIRSAQGAYNTPTYLEAVSHPDSRGEVWTHYWDYQHSYSRFDYVMVSKTARKMVENKECRILDAPEWKDASDHRALLTIFEW